MATIDQNLEAVVGGVPQIRKRPVPDGVWVKCPGCMATIYRKEAVRRQNVCPKCQYHFYVSAAEQISQVLDEGTFRVG